jgi:hypothetical protein
MARSDRHVIAALGAVRLTRHWVRPVKHRPDLLFYLGDDERESLAPCVAVPSSLVRG